MSPRKSRLVMVVLAVIGLIMMFFAIGGRSLNMTLLLIGLCLVMAGVIVQLIYWKCPHCHRRLPDGHLDMTYCPYCGENID